MSGSMIWVIALLLVFSVVLNIGFFALYMNYLKRKRREWFESEMRQNFSRGQDDTQR